MESKDNTRSKQSKITSSSLRKIVSEEGSFEKLLGTKKFLSPLLCDIDRMTPEDLQQCLKRAKEEPLQPFSFLTKIPSEENLENSSSKTRNKSTEIDIQLSNLIKRVELNRILLERTNQRVKDIDFLVKKSESILPTNQYYDEKEFLKMKSSDLTKQSKVVTEINYPEIEELCRTMNDTKNVLDYVKKISNEEMSVNDLPADLLAHVGSSASEINEKINEKKKFDDETSTKKSEDEEK